MASSKPETTFIRGVHKYLPHTYFEKTNNPYRGGTADVWYSGDLGDLWVEYKYVPKIVRSDSIRLGLSELQKLWLNSRYDEGRSIAVILGCPKGGVIFENKDWMNAFTQTQLMDRVITRKEVAAWIFSKVGTKICPSHLP